jgi:hypothetical protein
MDLITATHIYNNLLYIQVTYLEWGGKWNDISIPFIYMPQIHYKVIGPRIKTIVQYTKTSMYSFAIL